MESQLQEQANKLEAGKAGRQAEKNTGQKLVSGQFRKQYLAGWAAGSLGGANEVVEGHVVTFFKVIAVSKAPCDFCIDIGGGILEHAGVDSKGKYSYATWGF